VVAESAVPHARRARVATICRSGCQRRLSTKIDAHGALSPGPSGLPEVPPGYATPFANFSVDHYPWARKAYYHGLLDSLEGIKERGYAFWNNASRGEASALLYALLHREQAP
jgi:hypothetical protein